MGRLVATALLVGALLCVASAARVSTWDRVESAMKSGNNDKALRWLRQRLSGGGEEKGAYIAIKYEVPPSLHDEFVDEWYKFEKEVSREEGNELYDLAKTGADNLFFWVYGEWETFDDYMKHFESEYTDKWLDFLDDRDITWQLFPLANIADNAEKGKGGGELRLSRKGKGKGGAGKIDDFDPRDNDAHIVIQYHVPPSLTDDFVGVWKDHAESTWDEKDNRIYALRKVETLNHHYLAYGTWESFDAYWDHFTSKHARKLREYLGDNDIEWYIEPVIKFGGSEEDM